MVEPKEAPFVYILHSVRPKQNFYKLAKKKIGGPWIPKIQEMWRFMEQATAQFNNYNCNCKLHQIPWSEKHIAATSHLHFYIFIPLQMTLFRVLII